MCRLRRIKQRGQQCKAGTLASIISPQCKQQVFRIMHCTTLQCCFGCPDTIPIMRCQPRPWPQTAGEPCAGMQFFMCGQHCIIVGPIRWIIVPVNQSTLSGIIFLLRHGSFPACSSLRQMPAEKNISDHIKKRKPYFSPISQTRRRCRAIIPNRSSTPCKSA